MQPVVWIGIRPGLAARRSVDGFMVFWFYVVWLLSLGFMVLWLYSFVVLWFSLHCFLFYGCIVYGFKVLRCLGFYGFTVS